MSPALIIVMGVSGCGKSTTGAALAKALGGSHFQDADDLHPKPNVDKMSTGQPLTDADRIPWLTLVRSTAEHLTSDKMAENDIVVIACSALKRSYRSILRGASPQSLHRYPLPSEHSHPSSQSKSESLPLRNGESLEKPSLASDNQLKTYFVFIDGPRELLLSRMTARKGHFMKETMLDSQLATLERPLLRSDGNEDSIGKDLVEDDVVMVDLATETSEQVLQAIMGLKELDLRMPQS